MMDRFFKIIGVFIEILSPFAIGFVIMKYNGLLGYILGISIMLLYGIYLFVYKFKE